MFMKIAYFVDLSNIIYMSINPSLTQRRIRKIADKKTVLVC